MLHASMDRRILPQVPIRGWKAVLSSTACEQGSEITGKSSHGVITQLDAVKLHQVVWHWPLTTM